MADSRGKATLIYSFLTSLLLHAGLFSLLLMIKIDNHNIGFYVRLLYSTEVSSWHKAFSSAISEKPIGKGLDNTSRNSSLPINTPDELMTEALSHQLPVEKDILPEDSGYVLNVLSEEGLDGEGISIISVPGMLSIQEATATVPSSNDGGGLNNSKGPVEVVFGLANGPSFLKMVKPEYPKLARRLGKEGRVLFRLHIDETGRLINLEIVERAGYGFDEAALSAIRASSFRPAIKDGTPVPSVVYLPVRFVLETP